jgi:D-alanyl-D-alanine carboxypeptidase
MYGGEAMPKTMKKTKAAAMTLALIVLASVPVLWAEPILGQAKADRLQSTLEAWMEHYGVSGAIAGLWFPGTGTWVSTAGVGNPNTGKAPNMADKVRIGSITKSFTATLVLQLVDEGLLGLDDPLSTWEPWIPGAEGITIRQLLNMTSGLVSYTELDDFWNSIGTNPEAEWTPRKLVEISVEKPRHFSPGSEYMYCNTNYILLGMIIEKLTARPVEVEITERILVKLGLADTSFPTDAAIPEPYMRGYSPAFGEDDGSDMLVQISRHSPSPFWTAGAMIGTLNDLLVWIQALTTGELLSSQMHAEQFNFSGSNTKHYGLGVMNGAGVMVGHSGEVPGYNSSMYYIPSLDAISIVLINRYPSEDEGAADLINIALIEAMLAPAL